MEQWRIQRNRTACEKPGCPLAGEREYFAILQLPDCVRFERCAACFEELRNDSGEMPFFWKVRRDASGKQESTLNLEAGHRLH